MSAHAITDGLRDITGSFANLFKEADGTFLTVGDRLGEAVTTFATLTATFGGLPPELEKGDLREAAETLRRVARDVSTMGDALVGERAALTQLLTLNQDVGFRIDHLRKTVSVIAILAVNAQIAAAGIDSRHEDFSIFTREVARLTKTVGATIAEYAREYQALTTLLRSASATQAAFESEHREMLHSVAQQLDASLAAVDFRREKAADAAVEIGNRSTQISRAVSAAVMALQISDITRQRTEHVGHALTLLDQGLSSSDSSRVAGGSWSASLTMDQKEAVAAGVSRLQSAQLSHAASDYEGEINRITGSLKTLAQDASAMVTLGNEMYGTAEKGSGSFLEDLEAKLRMTDALVQKCQTARSDVDHVIKNVTASLNELLQRVNSVRDIEVDMRLVGLNMALKCGRLGFEGDTLRVIARELRGYAQQILADAGALMAAVQEVVSAAGNLASERVNQGVERIGSLEQEMARSLQSFQAGGTRLSQALAALSKDGGQVGRLLMDTADYLATHDQVAQVLRAARERLDAISDRGDATEQDNIVRDRVQTFTKGQYTMAAERDIHQRFDGRDSGRPAASAAPIRDTAPVAEDFLF